MNSQQLQLNPITAPDRTQLNSTQLAVELSWVLKSDHIASRNLITLRTLNSTEIVQFSVSLVSLNKFRISTTSWVELSPIGGGGWLREKLVLTQFPVVNQ